MTKNNTFTLDGKTIRAMDVIHIMFVVVAAVGLYFTIINKQSNFADKQARLDIQVARIEAKQDSMIERLARIEGALGTKPVSKAAQPPTQAQVPTPKDLSLKTPEGKKADESATLQPVPQPQPTPQPTPTQEILEKILPIKLL